MARRRRYVMKPRMKIMIALLVMSYFITIFIRQEVILHRQKLDIDSLNQEIQAIQMDNEALEQSIQYAESPEFIERVARERLGLVKEGEKILVDKSSE